MPYLLDIYKRLPLEIESGRDVYLYDKNGVEYLDFTSGIATVNFGHCNQYIKQKLAEQMERLWHCSNVFFIREQEYVAKRICDQTFADKVFFCSSGLEALEAAVKFIRRHFYQLGKPHKNRIITLKNGFHGRSITGISAGGGEYAKLGFAPLLNGFDVVEANNISQIQNAINERTAAILLELIQSEGGVNVIEKDYIKELRKIADKNGLLLCFDEVQTGFGRIGDIFYYKKIDVEPDLLISAKGIGNGFPIGACLLRDCVAKNLSKGCHGGTYSGNPLAMTVCNAVLDILEDQQFLKEAFSLGQKFKYHLKIIAKEFSCLIKEVRGDGMLLGIEFDKKVDSIQFLKECIKNRLLITKTSNPSVVRILPPLVSKPEHIDKAVLAISCALKAFL